MQVKIFLLYRVVLVCLENKNDMDKIDNEFQETGQRI